jgi:hypothetical protein
MKTTRLYAARQPDQLHNYYVTHKCIPGSTAITLSDAELRAVVMQIVGSNLMAEWIELNEPNPLRIDDGAMRKGKPTLIQYINRNKKRAFANARHGLGLITDEELTRIRKKLKLWPFGGGDE